jgi:hypothetical protein
MEVCRFSHHPYIHKPPDIFETCERRVRVWWFPPDFTQTHINGRYEPNGKKGSNACTIICILMAHRVHDEGFVLRVQPGASLDRTFVSSFAQCISEGNAIHERMLRNGELTHMNLTVPEAMSASMPRSAILLEWFYVQKSLNNRVTMRQSLYDQITSAIRRWTSPYQISPTPASLDLYLILIADARSVLVVYQREMGKLTLIDSHSHLHSGAVVAQVDVHHVRDLCSWYEEVCHTIFGTKPDCYELSCLYVKSNSAASSKQHS